MISPKTSCTAVVAYLLRAAIVSLYGLGILPVYSPFLLRFYAIVMRDSETVICLLLIRTGMR